MMKSNMQIIPHFHSHMACTYRNACCSPSVACCRNGKPSYGIQIGDSVPRVDGTPLHEPGESQAHSDVQHSAILAPKSPIPNLKY